jgi:hypothetical protein
MSLLYKKGDGWGKGYRKKTKYIKISRLKWAGHVMQMDNNRITKRIFNTRPEVKRGTGRPKLRSGG